MVQLPSYGVRADGNIQGLLINMDLWKDNLWQLQGNQIHKLSLDFYSLWKFKQLVNEFRLGDVHGETSWRMMILLVEGLKCLSDLEVVCPLNAAAEQVLLSTVVTALLSQVLSLETAKKTPLTSKQSMAVNL